MKYKPDMFAIAGGKTIMGLNPFGIMGVVIAVHEAAKKNKEEPLIRDTPKNKILFAVISGIVVVSLICLALHYWFPFKG